MFPLLIHNVENNAVLEDAWNYILFYGVLEFSSAFQNYPEKLFHSYSWDTCQVEEFFMSKRCLICGTESLCNLINFDIEDPPLFTLSDWRNRKRYSGRRRSQSKKLSEDNSWEESSSNIWFLDWDERQTLLAYTSGMLIEHLLLYSQKIATLEIAKFTRLTSE